MKMPMKQARLCFDCIHKDVCKHTEEASEVEAVLKKCGNDIPIQLKCKRKHEDTM